MLKLYHLTFPLLRSIIDLQGKEAAVGKAGISLADEIKESTGQVSDIRAFLKKYHDILLIAVILLLLILVGLLISANQRNQKIIAAFEWDIRHSFNTIASNHAEAEKFLTSMNLKKPKQRDLELLNACYSNILTELVSLDDTYRRINSDQDEYQKMRQGIIQYYFGASDYLLRRTTLYQKYEETGTPSDAETFCLELVAGLNGPILEIARAYQEEFHLDNMNSFCQALNDGIRTYCLEVYNKDLNPAFHLQSSTTTIFDWFEEADGSLMVPAS